MKTKPNDSVSAIELLESQHREVEELFEQFEEASEDDEASEESFALARLICERLSHHAIIEEEFFYPAARTDETEDLLAEAAIEHLSAKRLIADIGAMSAGDEALKATVRVLKEQIEHHVEEEEENLFPQVSQDLSAEKLEKLAERMQDRLAELHKSMSRVNSVPAKSNQRPPTAGA